MNSYRIDTFEMENGTWKAAVYKCGRFIGEAEAGSEGWAVNKVALILSLALERGEL